MADDRRIDEALRDVSLPGGLADRVTVESLFDDAAIDRLLARVAVPTALADRIRAAAFAPAPGRAVDLDRAAGVLPVTPAEAGRRGHSFARWCAAHAARGAVAVALLAGMIAVGVDFTRRIDPAPRPALVLGRITPPRQADPTDVPIAMADEEPLPTLEPPDPLLPAAVLDDVGAAELVIAPPDDPAGTGTEVLGAAVGAAAGPSPAGRGMRIVPLPQAGPRRAVPRVAGFDMAFEMAHGEQPFVDPQVAALAVDRPPLVLRTDAFDALVEAIAGRQRLPAAALRTEELLAALPSPVRSPPAGPQIVIQAVRSLRARPESFLVEVSVLAPPLDLTDRDPVDAILVLDRASGSRPLVWPRICRAVAAVAAQMRDGDRVSVVVGGRQPRVAGRRIDASALQRLAAVLATEPSEPHADFDATMRAATEEVAGTRRPLIVVTNVESVDQSRGEGRAALAAWRQSLARGAAPDAERTAAVRFVLIDPEEPAAREPAEPGFGRTPCDGGEIARAVVERVFAMPTLRVRQCRLDVAFDPRVVAAYRLVGHRQSALESLASGPPAAIDLHAGETARVVYEVIPRTAGGTAVTATLSCRPVGAASVRTVSSRFSLQSAESGLLPSPHGCELLLATGIGELVAGSAHLGPRGAAVQAVADLASAWLRRGDVTAHGSWLIAAGDRLGLVRGVPPNPGRP